MINIMAKKSCGIVPCGVKKRARDSAKFVLKIGISFFIAAGISAAIFFIWWGVVSSDSVTYAVNIKAIDPATMQWWQVFFTSNTNIYSAALYTYYFFPYMWFIGIISIIAFFVLWILLSIFWENA
jgi:hypothetical protein